LHRGKGSGKFVDGRDWPRRQTCPTVEETLWGGRAMRLRGHDDDQLDVRISVDELVLLKNVLHEVCNSMSFSDSDFQAIFGANRLEMEALLQRTTGVLSHLGLVAE
jgi:hypothetical protein